MQDLHLELVYKYSIPKLYKFLKSNNKQIIRFLISGLIASSTNYLVYKSINLIFNNLLFASSLGYLSGLLVSFVFAKNWVFRNKSTKRLCQSFYFFFLIYLLGGIEMFFVIKFLDQLINNHEIAWLIGALLAASNNYFGSKYVSFR
jgi:putative flippase GtrA